MKKICILILCAFLLSGCTANYHLVYKENIFSETLEVTDNKNSIIAGQNFSNLINNYYNNIDVIVNYKIQMGDFDDNIVSQNGIYRKSLINKDNLYGINLSYNYNEGTNYTYSSIVYTMFDTIDITNEHIYTSNAKNLFSSYSGLNEIIVSFKTDKFVNYTNSDKQNGDTYYWYFTESNYSDKNIKVDFSDEDNRDFVEILKEETENIEDETYDTFFKYTYITLGVVLLFIGIFVLIKFKNSNKK